MNILETNPGKFIVDRAIEHAILLRNSRVNESEKLFVSSFRLFLTIANVRGRMYKPEYYCRTPPVDECIFCIIFSFYTHPQVVSGSNIQA